MYLDSLKQQKFISIPPWHRGLLSLRFSPVDGFAFVSIVTLVIQAPAFLYEDVLYLNYVLNVQNPHALYFYNDYIQVIPQITAYLLKFLPPFVQAVLYRVVSLAVILVLYRELKKLLGFCCNETEACFLALAIIFFMRFVDPVIIAQVSYTIWSAFLAAFVYIVRKQIEQSSYSMIGIFGVLFAALSQPLAILLVPILLSDVRLKTQSANNVANISLSASILGWSMLQYFMGSTKKWAGTNPRTVYDAFVFWFHHDFKLQIVLIMLSALVLLATLLASFVSTRRIGWRIRLNIILVYFGVFSFVFYLASPRFLLNLSGRAPFQPRYMLLLSVCALIAGIFAVSTANKTEVRSIVVGSIFGFCLALTTLSIYQSVTGPLKDAARKYEFLIAATEFRNHCHPEEVLAYEKDWWSPVMFCNRQDFPEGWTSVTEFKSWAELPSMMARNGFLPGIYSGKPLF
jgi:hypothetical protein